MTDFVIVGNPGSRRVELFQAALTGLGNAPAEVLSYGDFLSGRRELPGLVREGSVVRIESPGKDFAVEKALLVEGAAESEEYEGIPAEEAGILEFDRGQILYPRQWYRGFCRVLRRVEEQLEASPSHRRMNMGSDIAVMFDKSACHARLEARGIPVPRGLGEARSHEDLLERMQRSGCFRVFVKLAHGSSASGTVAYATSGGRHLAVTTVEMVRQNGELRLYNSRQIQVHRDPRVIAELIDTLCRHRVHVEQWLPKAALQGRVLDLRVVVIGGQAKHTVGRLSRTPITNLHLLNERCDAAPVAERMGFGAWSAAIRACEEAMNCFPESLYAGIDLLIGSDFRRHAVLEVNAFGDLLPGVCCNGVDTYTAEIQAASLLS